jgi:hypothetical protein
MDAEKIAVIMRAWFAAHVQREHSTSYYSFGDGARDIIDGHYDLDELAAELAKEYYAR